MNKHFEAVLMSFGLLCALVVVAGAAKAFWPGPEKVTAAPAPAVNPIGWKCWIPISKFGGDHLHYEDKFFADAEYYASFQQGAITFTNRNTGAIDQYYGVQCLYIP